MSPDLTFWLELVFKMAMTAAVVVFISVVVERSGPFIGAMIAALPTAAGAAYVIFAIEHPPAFIAASAVGSMAIGAAVAIFAAVYAVLAQRHGLALSVGVALLVWFASAALLRQFDWTPLRALVLNAAVYAVTIPLSWRYRSSAPPRKFLRTRYDIPLRALAAATVVVIVTSASHSIGSLLGNVRAVPDRVLQLDRDFASARRRQGDRKRHGARAGGADRADAGLYGCTLSRRTARFVVGALDWTVHLGRLERHADAGAEQTDGADF
jgi:uncharacterized membrane protein (GlpM family)